MKEEILSRLKSAEDETSRRTEAARGRARDIVKEAQARAQEILRTAEEESRRDQSNELQGERQRLEAERNKILETSRVQEEKMRTSFRTKQDELVRKAVETFTRSLDA